MKKNKFSKHKDLVTNALIVNKSSRNNDWELMFTILEQNGMYYLSAYQKEQIIKSGINFHTAVRERRRIQKEGFFLPTDPKILKRRNLLAADYAEEYQQ